MEQTARLQLVRRLTAPLKSLQLRLSRALLKPLQLRLFRALLKPLKLRLFRAELNRTPQTRLALR